MEMSQGTGVPADSTGNIAGANYINYTDSF